MTGSGAHNNVVDHLIAHDKTRLMEGRVIFLQPKSGYRSAIDPIFLAAAVDAKPGHRVLDVGSGTGAASLCLAARVKNLEITGLELQSEYAELARQSARLNNGSTHLKFEIGNLANVSSLPELREYDHVMTNPPFMEQGRGRTSPDRGKALANEENALGLSAWLEACIRMIKSRGTLTVIHRADRLEHILATISGAMGEIVVIPLWPYQKADGEAKTIIASRVIVRARKSVKTPGVLSQGLVIHQNQSGQYSDDAERVLTGVNSLSEILGL